MSIAWSIACVLVVVSSPFKIEEIHTIQTRPNVIQIIAMRRTNISTSVLHRFVYWQERCAIFKDRKTNSSCFFNVIYDHKTVAERDSFNLATFNYHCKIYQFQFPCLSLVCTGCRVIFARVIFASTYGFALYWLCPNNVMVRERKYETLEFFKSKYAKWQRESEMSENKLGTHCSLIQYTLYKYICFRPQLILILAVAFGPLLGRYLLLHSSIST